MKNIYRKLRLAKQYVSSLYGKRGYEELFDQVETFCMFLGFPRTGHSLMGALLDAHPDIVLANGIHAFRHIRYGFSKNQLFYLLLEKSRRFAQEGSVYTGYRYAVPNQWQGRFRNLRVIGDRRGDASVIKLEAHRNLLPKLRRMLDMRLRFIHVTRNPYDSISTMFRKSSATDLREAVEKYFVYVEAYNKVRVQVEDDELITMKHEAIIKDSVSSLQALCRRLGVEAPQGYLNDCASIVFDAPRKTRTGAPWLPDLIQEVLERMESYPFLKGYTFDG